MTNDQPQTAPAEIPATTRFLWRRDDWMRKVTADIWLKPVDRLLGVYLALRMNAGNQATWPSQPTIARDLGISKPAVARSVKNLRKEGWLRVTRTERRFNVYEIKLPSED